MGVTWTKNVLKILALAIAWEQKQEKKQNVLLGSYCGDSSKR